MWLLFSISTVLFLYILFEIFLIYAGDCEISVVEEEVKPYYFTKDKKLIVYFESSFKNKGKQQALIIDCMARLEPEIDKFSNLDINLKMINLSNPRNDGYWEACILKPEKNLPFRVLIEISHGIEDLQEFFNRIESFKVDLFYKFYGRTPMKYARREFSINFKDIKCAELTEKESESKIIKIIKTHDINAMPVRTLLLRPGDDLAQVINKYALPFKKGKSILAIAESALAIIQGRIKYVEDIKPSFIAKKFTRLFDKDSSMSSVYSLETALKEAGALRIILALIIGMTGKLIGRKGDFYRIAGKKVTAIDDCTGTIPPFDKCIVLCPANLKEEINKLKKETGFEIAIVDVNDLKRVDILASTCPEKNKYLSEALINNPQGNADEQTPLVLVNLL